MARMGDIEREAAEYVASLRREWDRGVTAAEDRFTRRPHASQAPPVTAATVRTTTTTEDHMSAAIDAVRADLAAASRDLAAHAAAFDQTTLPGIVARLDALAANPVVDAALAAAHVPPEYLKVVVDMLGLLSRDWQPQDAAQAQQAA